MRCDRKAIYTSVLALAVTLVPMSARAQFPTVTFNLAAPTAMNTMMRSVRDHNAVRSPRGETRFATPSARGAPPSAAQSARLTYTPSLAVRKRNMAQFIAQTRAVDPAIAANLQAESSKRDLIVYIGAKIRPIGFSPDSVADTYALWWIEVWQAAHGVYDAPTPAIIRAVKRQAASAMLATPSLVAASDATKQELAEAFMIQVIGIETTMGEAKGNAEATRQAAADARMGASTMGLDLDAMRLTENGFEPV